MRADVQHEIFEETKQEKQRAAPALNDSASDGLGRTSKSLAQALDFYNTQILRSNWGRIGTNLSLECQKHMGEYLQGLKSVKNWALKSW